MPTSSASSPHSRSSRRCFSARASSPPTVHFWWALPNLDVAALKRVPNAVRVATIERAFAEASAEVQALPRAEIRSLGDAFAFGPHTSTHPALPMCTDDEAWLETEGSRTEVEQLTGRPVRHFAFPNGDFGQRELELVRAAGYHSARTTIVRWVDRHTDPYRFPILRCPTTPLPIGL